MRLLKYAAVLFILLLVLNGILIPYHSYQAHRAVQAEQSRLDGEAKKRDPVSPPPDTIILAFAGDIMAHTVNFNMRDYDKIYENVKPVLSSADLMFGNLESPVDNRQPYITYPRFNINTPYAEAAARAGFSVFSLANNHTNDHGAGGILETRRAMNDIASRHRIWFSGIKSSPQAPLLPVTIRKGSWKIGFIAVTTFLNSHEDRDYVYLFNYRFDSGAEAEFLQLLETVRPLYDILVVSVHDGIEYVHTPVERKVEFFRRIADSGADIVWGHHPHVLQPWELYEPPARTGFGSTGAGSTSGQKSLLMYSMGNFISGQTWNITADEYGIPRAATGDSAVLFTEFERIGDAPVLTKVHPSMISNYRDPVHGMIVKPLDQLVSDPDIPEDWRDYYRRRRDSLEWFLTPGPEVEAETGY